MRARNTTQAFLRNALVMPVTGRLNPLETERLAKQVAQINDPWAANSTMATLMARGDYVAAEAIEEKMKQRNSPYPFMA